MKWGLKIWTWVNENCTDRLIIAPDSHYSSRIHTEKPENRKNIEDIQIVKVSVG